MAEFSSNPTRIVGCRICALDGVDKRVEAKRLMGHIGGAHSKAGWNKAKYSERFGEGDYSFYQPDIAQATAQINAVNTRKAQAAETPAEFEGILADPNLSLLKDDERAFYDGFYNIVLQAVDRDEVQMPVISSLAMDMVIMKRLRRTQLTLTDGDTKGIGLLKNLEDAIEKAEKRIQSSMKALCISREMLMKTREQIRSTAASLISGYMDEIERNTPEALEALMIDEKRILARMHPRIEKMLLQHARDLEPEDKEEDDGNDGAVVSLEEALQRAGVSI